MPFVPPNSMVRERILSFGGAGMGKSTDFYAIAAKYVATGTEAKFYVIDTDVSYEQHLARQYNDVMEADIIRPYDVYNWTSLMGALDEVLGWDGSNNRPKRDPLMKRGDWLMIDLLSPSWDYVQGWYTDEVFNKSRVEYMLQMRHTFTANQKDAKVFDGWKDWPFITAVYKDDLQNRLLRAPGHVYCTSEVKKLDTSTAESDTKSLYGPYGVFPVGQKRTPHIFRTVVLKTLYEAGTWSATTIKDTGREYMQRTPIASFPNDYLIKVGGWKFEMPVETAA